MKDEYGRSRTAKQIAHDKVQSAIWGRLQRLIDEVDEDLDHLTEKQNKEVKRHLELYLKRMEKAIGQHKSK